ncbi:MAG: hypothetical protein CVU56_00570 [Deltaproteobacteria bacterium HGW-Deltaproteobacteria-14]|jgi:hypothetical protein|nr:MAG: hypothetical protein CVU56_00570 [Deltaproteobacteria bacterium HGW-Deltaproteobacteria-14]
MVPQSPAELREHLKESIDRHIDGVTRLGAVVAELERAADVARPVAEQALDDVLRSGRRVRDALHVAHETLSNDGRADEVWPVDMDDLRARVTDALEALDALVVELPERRIRLLAAELRSGRCVGGWRARRWEEQREMAAAELERILAEGASNTTGFDGPDGPGESWLRWFWALENGTQERVIDGLGGAMPALVDFLATVDEPAWTAAGPKAGEAETDEPADADVAEDEGGYTTAASTQDEVNIQDASSEGAPPDTLTPTLPRPDAEPPRPFTLGGSAEPARVLASQPEALVRGDGDQAGVGPADTGDLSADVGVSAANETPSTEQTPERPDDRPPLQLDVGSKVVEATPRRDFVANYWLEPDGTAAPAPWTKDDFNESIVDAQSHALLAGEWATAYVMGAAAAELALDEAAPAWLLDWTRAFARGPSASPELPVDLVRRIRVAIASGSAEPAYPGTWLAAVMLALDTSSCPLADETISELCTQLRLNEGTRALLEEWLVHQRISSAAAVLERQLAAPLSDTALEAAQHEAAGALHEALKRLFSAAGGTVQTTHCRRAWDNFMGGAAPTLSRISESRLEDSDRSTLARLREESSAIFDRGGAKLKDRRHMDKGVEELVVLASAVLTARDAHARAKTEARRAANAPRFSDLAVGAASSSTGGAPIDNWIVGLVRSHLGVERHDIVEPVFTAGSVYARPLLVEAWPDFTPSSPELDARRVSESVRAAARLLGPPVVVADGELDDWLASHRPDLLPTSDDLSPSIVRELERHQQRSDDELQQLAAELRELHLRLAELADGQASIAADAVALTEHALDTHLTALDRAWLCHCRDKLRRRAGQLTDRLVAAALEEGLSQAEARRILASGDIGALLRALGQRPHSSGPRRYRATLYRRDAAKRWPDPLEALNRLIEPVQLDNDVKNVVSRWIDTTSKLRRRRLKDQDDAKLREAFVELVFKARALRRSSHVRNYTPRGDKTHYSQIDVESVQSWLVEGVNNPTFLPQISRYRTLSLKVSPLPSVSPALSRRIQSEATNQELTLILVPGLHEEQRRQIHDRLATASLAGPVALIDDLDLCRLLNVGGEAPDPLLALLELVAEQQRWSRFCPYEVVEGQHVRLEMFVGRQTEAEALATRATYSRIFSGRRLGKTALLRFVEGNPNLKTLPSGNNLRVVFCSIAGMETEQAVARAILSAVGELLDVKNGLDASDPVEHLKSTLPQRLAEHPDVSLLLLLDEADTFFAAQIESPTSERQQSLSWWMSRHAEEIRDQAGLPRIRFVFCGYLRTDQNRGVWENKGDVLLLGPLDADGAVELAAGPLARLGIDAREQADNIAFRCGYQPAVIIRFGLSLIEHLERTRPRQDREQVTVTAKDVVDVFLSNAVQNAIYEICWLNFVGHPRGKLIFAGLLMELQGRVPSAAIDDAPERILAHIQAVEGFDPTELGGEAWADLVRQELRGLVDRSLIVQTSHRPDEYRLRFPHHLPVLVQREPARHIRDALKRLRASGGTQQPTWLLSESVLESVRFCLSDLAVEADVRGAAVASHWLPPLVDADNGLARRLGLANGSDGTRVLTGKAAINALETLESRTEPVLLIGGSELARGAQRLQSRAGPIDLARTGRLSKGQVDSWLRRRRAAEFTALNPLDPIMRCTAGIPILVARFDELLATAHPEAPTLDAEALNGLVAALEASYGEIAAQLTTEGSELHLTLRERELIHMVARASEEFGDDLAAALRADIIEAGPRRFGPQDGDAIQVLLALGLLPRSPTRSGSPLDEVAPLRVDDPVLRIVPPSAG